MPGAEGRSGEAVRAGPAARGDRGLVPSILVVLAVLALWIDFSGIQGAHDSDSLLQVLVSLQRWTPFYWGQDRFGMLLPLLAAPIDDPYHNLLFQVALRLFALSGSFFLLARLVVPRPYWPAAGASALGIFLAGAETIYQYLFSIQPYGQSFALSLAGLILLERGGRSREIAGVLLLVLGSWLAVTTALWLLPLIWLRRTTGLAPYPQAAAAERPCWRLWPRPSDLRRRQDLLLLLAPLAAFGLNLLAARFGAPSTSFAALPVAAWPAA